MIERKSLCSIQELVWDDVRQDIISTNSELVDIIDQISPSKEYTIFKVKYPYGTKILKEGLLYLPDKHGNLLPITECSSDIRKKLGYNLDSNPVSIVLNNSVELFLSLEDRIVPFYGLIPAGSLFGAWKVVSPGISHHPVFLWDMTAGARSIFMLPKITESGAHDKLRKKMHLTAEKPKTLLDHWGIFKQIANNYQVKDPWHTELLFFSKKWFEQLDDKAWESFNYYILKKAWDSGKFGRSEFIWDLIFSLIQKRRHIKPSPHIDDTVKRILAISVGIFPGFAPAPALDNNAAPIDLLQQSYMEYYKLKDYAPIIMQPTIFNVNNG